MENFQSFQLPSSIDKALTSMGFEKPTPIQVKAIPLAMTGKNIIGCAQTGTGKTAAFCIPILAQLSEMSGKMALILVPTRELAQQIEEFWRQLTRFSSNMNCVSLVGGLSFEAQLRSLSRRPRLVVATPGRLLDHLNRRTLKLNNAAVLVLDEADRMLDMGFAPQLNQIVKYLPETRQTLFFSATWEASMAELARKFMSDAIEISVENTAKAAPKIEQAVVETSSVAKNEALLDELNQREGSVLIFARTQIRTDRLARYLTNYGMMAQCMHGGRTQAQRNSALAAFKHGRVRVLVATDVASRGIDVADIAHVINYDLPQTPEDYIHRIGRTGRAGSSGQAVTFITPEDRSMWREIIKLLKKSGVETSHLSKNIVDEPVRNSRPRIQRFFRKSR